MHNHRLPRPAFVAGFALALVCVAGISLAENKSETTTEAAASSIYAGHGNQALELAGTATDAGFVINASMTPAPGITFPMSNTTCSSTPQNVVSVGTSAVAVPATSLAGRIALRICVSIENAGSPKVKCQVNGWPVMGFTSNDAGTPNGDVLAPGDCIVYAVTSAATVRCIADTPATGVLTYECAP